MVSAFDTRFFATVFVTLLVVMDPLGNVPIFLSLTAGYTQAKRRRLAWQSVLVAGGVIAVFAVFGQQILQYLGITVPALEVSGGLLLLLVSLQLLTGQEQEPSAVGEVNVALVPLGTPLIAGPGAIAATIVFSRQAHGGRDALAIAAALALVLIILWLSLRFSLGIRHVLRDGGIHLLTRVFGLLLAAIAVQLVAEGVAGFIHAYRH
jgi:multiple antibiotic resistance protein